MGCFFNGYSIMRGQCYKSRYCTKGRDNRLVYFTRGDDMALTIKKKQVADDYIITGNKTDSYLKFYKNVKNRETAAAAASRLFNTQEMKDYIEERMKELDEELIADQREVLRGLTRQFRREEIDYQVVMVKKPSFDDNGNFLGIEEKPEVIKLPTQNKDSIKAGELLGKRFGMWTDKIDMEGDVNIVLEDDYGD